MPCDPTIKTFGEILPEFMIELVSGGLSQTTFKLLLWDGNKAQVEPRVSIKPVLQERFAGGIVVGVAATAHADLDAVLPQQIGVIM